MTTDVAATTEADAPLTSPSHGQPERSQSRQRRVLLAAGAVAVVGVIGWGLLASPLLAVKEVEVTGLGPVEQEQVLSAAAIAPGAAMLTLDTSSAAERISRLDAVAGAQVQRQWPTTVRISVVPDVPVGTSQEGQRWWVWGAQGGQLAEVDEPPLDVPRLADIPAESREEALGVLTALPTEVRPRVEQISWDERRGYVLTLRESAGAVRWGDTAEPAAKTTVLNALLAAAPDARWFDVSAPRAPRSAVAEPVPVPRDPEKSTTGQADEPDSSTDGEVDDPESSTAGQADDTEASTTGGGGEQSLGLQPR